MSNILTTLFSDPATFRKYGAGSETNSTFDDFLPSAVASKKQIEIIISPATYLYVAGKTTADDPEREALRSAMANLILAKQSVFDSIARRKANIAVYKNELEAMRRSYLENYYLAMDTLIQLLEDDTDESSNWKSSRYANLLSSVKITKTEDFDIIYPIDLSFLFFFRTIPLQKESLDEGLNAYFDKIDETDTVSKAMINLALAKKTVSKALRRFDILEFPPTIRNLFEESKESRSGKDEVDNAISLANDLDNDVSSLLSNIDTILSDAETTDVSTQTSFNDPCDKIILFP